MAFAYKNFSTLAGTTQSTSYTCPAATTAQISFLQVCNVHATATAEIAVVMRDESAATDYHIVANLSVPVGATISLLDGTLILEAADSIRITASTASVVRLLGSAVERS